MDFVGVFHTDTDCISYGKKVGDSPLKFGLTGAGSQEFRQIG